MKNRQKDYFMSEQVKEFGLTIPIYNDFIIIQSHKDNFPDNLTLPEFADAGFWRDKDGNLHIWLSKNINKWQTITHECVHIANRILSERNIVYYPEQDEALAYLVGFLCENVSAAYNQLYFPEQQNKGAKNEQ